MHGFFDRFLRFMYGRNGIDRLCRFLFLIYTILVIANIFANSFILYILSLLLAIYALFRVFSKNVPKRQRENLFYVKKADKVKGFLKRQQSRIRDRKTHKYVKCPFCKSHLRVKRAKGKHTVRCPRCSKTFDTTIR